jgi:sirohydrochlorin cobaltochelatase
MDSAKVATMPLMTTALILFAHGSRNSAWKEPFERIAQTIRAQGSARVELAFLELMTPTLPDVLHQLTKEGVMHFCVVPLFFGLGNHVSRDLQDLIHAFKNEHPEVHIRVSPPLGESDVVLQAMANYAVEQMADSD